MNMKVFCVIAFSILATTVKTARAEESAQCPNEKESQVTLLFMGTPSKVTLEIMDVLEEQGLFGAFFINPSLPYTSEQRQTIDEISSRGFTLGVDLGRRVSVASLRAMMKNSGDFLPFEAKHLFATSLAKKFKRTQIAAIAKQKLHLVLPDIIVLQATQKLSVQSILRIREMSSATIQFEQGSKTIGLLLDLVREIQSENCERALQNKTLIAPSSISCIQKIGLSKPSTQRSAFVIESLRACGTQKPGDYPIATPPPENYQKKCGNNPLTKGCT